VRGEVLALLAPSGAGKTTTLRIVLGLDRDFTGSVWRNSERLGVMFQEPRLLPWLTVAENVGLVRPGGIPPGKLETLLAAVGLPGMQARRPRELSLGMARRVALARALAAEPHILVLDEPFVSLEPRLATGLLRMVAEHARRNGTTVLIATHAMEEALAFADRLLVLAGQPASLSIDQAVPDRADARQMDGLLAMLRTRFPFLATPAGTEQPGPAPASGQEVRARTPEAG
jgi:NitT/TauT family transport system ATP-binding protein